MQSKYGIFCEVIEKGSFTKAARQMGYTQSAVSQTIKSLERELGTVLIERRKDGIALSADGRAFFPYFQDIYNGEKALEQKRREMEGPGKFYYKDRNLYQRQPQPSSPADETV